MTRRLSAAIAALLVTILVLPAVGQAPKIKVDKGGLDGIMYDEADDKIILTNHSRPIGTLTGIDPKTGDIVGTAELEDNAPEGAAADGKGHIFVNNETKNTMQVIDVKTWKATASWPLAPCAGPTGIAYDEASNRLFSGCSKTSVVVDERAAKVVSSITIVTAGTNRVWERCGMWVNTRHGDEHSS